MRLRLVEESRVRDKYHYVSINDCANRVPSLLGITLCAALLHLKKLPTTANAGASIVKRWCEGHVMLQLCPRIFHL